MSLYPSLEDMKVDQMAKAQVYQEGQQAAAIQAPPQYPTQPQAYPTQAPAYPTQAPAYPTQPQAAGAMPVAQFSLYPSLDDYMGLSLTPEEVRANMPQVLEPPPSQAVVARPAGTVVTAPITGNSVQGVVGLQRAEIKQGVRQLMCCKDGNGKIGLRVRHVNKGVFVAFVHKDSPAALAGLRFGDQILQINEEVVAGWDMEKTMKYLKKCPPDRIIFAVRDRPFERTITMQKDSSNHIGFVFKNGKITAIAKDTSAARNGVLIEHQLIEVNGQNVVGLKDKEIAEIIAAGGPTVTITIMPTYVYNHIVKNMADSLVKKMMDHSIPDL
ncbi:syntenin-1-like [Branchiostoma floridae]|uniref:Syntenin-1-like n=1 Tax=Branchiostoma floridae TaxID=7739 RepID=A0A9J7HL11_BRAFL|nr:syntenin-1-like [Branchiostoma floridae]